MPCPQRSTNALRAGTPPKRAQSARLGPGTPPKRAQSARLGPGTPPKRAQSARLGPGTPPKRAQSARLGPGTAAGAHIPGGVKRPSIAVHPPSAKRIVPVT